MTGKRYGAYRHGHYTFDAMAERQGAKRLLTALNETLDDLAQHLIDAAKFGAE